jgi:hypothetical protein
MLLVAVGLGTYFFFFSRKSPLAPFASVIPQDATLALFVNLAEQERTGALREEAEALNQALRSSLVDLNLEPRTAKLTSIFIVTTKTGASIRVWGFEPPVRITKCSKGRYHEVEQDGTRFLSDRFDPGASWCVDKDGRLLSGPLELIEAALARSKAHQKTQGYDDLSQWIEEIPASALLWGTASFARTDLSQLPLPPVQADALQGTRISGGGFSLDYAEDRGLVLQATAFCPSSSDAQACREVLEDLKRASLRSPLLGLPDAQTNWAKRMMENSVLRDDGSRLLIDTSLPLPMARLALEAETRQILQAQGAFKERLREAYRERMKQGASALRDEHFQEAETAFTEALDLLPGDGAAQDQLNAARQAWERRKLFDRNIAEANQALASGDLDQAKTRLNGARKLRPLDSQLTQMITKWQDLVQERAFEKAFREGNAALAALDLAGAEDAFQAAARIRPKEGKVQESLTALHKARHAQSLVAKAEKALASQDNAAAYDAAKMAKEIVLAELKSAGESFKPIEQKLAGDTAQVIRGLIRSCRQSSVVCQERAEQAARTKDYATAVEEFTHGLQDLDKAMSFLKGFALLDGPKEAESTRKEIAADITALDLGRKKARGQASMQRARGLIAGAHEDLTLARKEGPRLLSARQKLRDALESLEEAKQLPGTAPDPVIEQTRNDLAKVAKLMRPLHVDINEGRALDGWAYNKEQLVFRTSETRTWAQAAGTASASLASPVTEFPVDFELAIEFSLLDRFGKLSNTSWRNFQDLLVITLLAKEKGAPDLVIKLGKERQRKLAEISMGENTHHLGHLADSNNPVSSLRLVRHRGRLVLLVDGKAMASSIAENDFKQVVITLTNGGRTQVIDVFPILFQVTLALHVKTK